MSKKITMDLELRFIDNATDGAKSASKAVDNIEKKAKSAGQSLDNLGKKKVKPSIDADATRIDKKMSKIDSALKKLGFRKTKTTIDADDKATSKLTTLLNKVRSWSGKRFKAFLDLKDSGVLRTLEKMSSGLKSLTGKTWSAVVKIKDAFTRPLTTLRNMLFNIKSLITGIAAAWAASKIFGGAISVADAYSSAKISFSTLLGEGRGQQMMDDLDVFAKATPFNTTNVIENAQKMLAMGWNPEDIIKDMEIIGNAAAATGKLDQGLESIVRAMSQIKTKGRLSTEELNQLAEAGIAAKAMLAEGLGYGTGDSGIAAMTADLEEGLIASDVAIQALLKGMQKYDGMMDSMANETVEGMMSQMKDAFSINIVRRWGQGLQDGAKRGLGTLLKLLDNAEGALESMGDTVYELGAAISNWAADKLENAVQRITEITGTDEFKNATLGGKISMLWDGAVVDPLKEWWEGGGRDKTIETAGKIGAWMGEAITNGLLAILGMTDILDDETASKMGEEGGMSIAQSFAKGFKENFDGSAITEAIVNAIDNVWDALPGWAKAVFGLYGAGKSAGGISKAAGAIHKVIGGNVMNDAGDVVGATGLIGLVGSTGNAMVKGTGILGKLAGAGYALKGGAASAGAYMGGAAAAGIGAAGIAGGVAGGGGILSGLWDIIKGVNSSGKEAKDSYFRGGTKLGLVGTGAGIGAAIGSAVPGIGTAVGALAGAGIGGLAALLGGDGLGKWLSDMADNLPAMGEAISQFFTVTLPEKWNGFWDSVGEFFSETIPYALGYATGKAYTFFTETLPEKWTAFWDSVGIFFTETIPAWANSVWHDHIVPFWTETLPGFISNLWEDVTVFFTESLPSIGSAIWNAISSFFTVTLPGWASSAFESVSSWWGGVKENFRAGFDAGSGGKARGGIVGGFTSLMAFARGGIASYSDGGTVRGGAKLIRVAEEGSPEMIIPLSSQRRQRGLDLWEKAGQMLGVPGFARGGRTDRGTDEGVRFWGAGNTGATGGQTVTVEVGGVHIELHVNADGSANIVEAVKAQLGEITDAVVGAIADELGAMFENTPVRGGA